MVYRLLADAVMLAHFGFLVFVVLGGFLAWRYRWVIGPHTAAAAWGLLSGVGAVRCPLTDWEDRFRRLAGEQGLTRGFIDSYLTGVVYPREHLVTVRFLIAVLVAVSWAGFVLLRCRASPSRAHPARASAVDVRPSAIPAARHRAESASAGAVSHRHATYPSGRTSTAPVRPSRSASLRSRVPRIPRCTPPAPGAGVECASTPDGGRVGPEHEQPHR